MSDNHFSYQYVRIAEIDRQVVGIAVLIPAEKVKLDTDHTKTLTFWQKIWLLLVENLIFCHILQHDYPEGTFYLRNLAVAPEYRDRGIGSQLILNCIEEASVTADRIFISVDLKNPRSPLPRRTNESETRPIIRMLKCAIA